ncbi:MAG: NUDIX domain-containing protein [Candidatus Thermoplasmatota archaeon]
MPNVVSCLLLHKDRLLILKRSKKVKTYKGWWGVIAGYIDPDEEPYERALKEIKEETGIKPDHVELINKGEPVKVEDTYENQLYEWVIHPFLFKLRKNHKIHIDWEHTEYRWIKPNDIKRYHTVPYLREIVQHMIK